VGCSVLHWVAVGYSGVQLVAGGGSGSSELQGGAIVCSGMQ